MLHRHETVKLLVYRVTIKSIPYDFCWYFSNAWRLLREITTNNQMYTLSPRLVETYWKMTKSHSGTVVPECIKDDSESQWDQWKWGKIRTPLPQKPLNRWSPNLAWVMTSGTPTAVQNFITIWSGVSAPRPRAPPPARARTKWLG